MSDVIQDTDPVPLSSQTSLDALVEQRVDLDHDGFGLALRFVVGLVSLGGDEAARRLQDMQRKLDADPELWSTESAVGHKTVRRQAWHLGVGVMRRGEKRLRRGLRTGYDLSLRASPCEKCSQYHMDFGVFGIQSAKCLPSSVGRRLERIGVR